MCLIEDHGGGFRENARVRRSIGLQFDGEIGKKQVMVDDDDVTLHRLAAHLSDETPFPLATFLTNAGIGASVELVPKQAGFRKFCQLRSVPCACCLLPGSDRAIL